MLQPASGFRGNGCISLLGKASSLALVGPPLAQHGVGGTVISLFTESKGCKTPTAVSHICFSGRGQGEGTFLPYASISWPWHCGAQLEKISVYRASKLCQ